MKRKCGLEGDETFGEATRELEGLREVDARGDLGGPGLRGAAEQVDGFGTAFGVAQQHLSEVAYRHVLLRTARDDELVVDLGLRTLVALHEQRRELVARCGARGSSARRRR